ncbi:MAG: hypothetical protein L0Z62_39165, partial [Gemmataceae bacterium]|nr:hypothetical protein [Gemmataceae bacterium]
MSLTLRADSPGNGTPGHPLNGLSANTVLGHVDWDPPAATNEHVTLRAPAASRPRILRNQFVRVEDTLARSQFLGRIIGGPFFRGT